MSGGIIEEENSGNRGVNWNSAGINQWINWMKWWSSVPRTGLPIVNWNKRDEKNEENVREEGKSERRKKTRKKNKRKKRKEKLSWAD